MNKFVLVGFLAFFSNTLFATQFPNIWTSGFGQGWMEYNISNEKAQSLQISCNVGYDDETDHKIIFLNGTKEYDGEDLAFLMDGNAYYPLAMPTSTRNGGNNWYEFSTNIGKITTIEVYNENQKIGEFKPTKQSSKKILNEGLCDPMQ